MSEPSPWPVLLLKPLEYAGFSRAEGRMVFHKARELRRAWGVLMCVDAVEARWTMLGDPEFVAALVAAETTGPSGPASGMGVPNALVVAEFPVDEFRAQWLLVEWPDRWPTLRRLTVIPWASVMDHHRQRQADADD